MWVHWISYKNFHRNEEVQRDIEMLTSKPQKVAKVVICGMKSIGKTTILEQLIYGNVTPDTVILFTIIWNIIILCHLRIILISFNSCACVNYYLFIGISCNNWRYICCECRYWKRFKRYFTYLWYSRVTRNCSGNIS